MTNVIECWPDWKRYGSPVAYRKQRVYRLYGKIEESKQPPAMLTHPAALAPDKEAASVSKTIPLSRGYVTVVDDEDYEWLSQWKWAAFVQQRGGVYATRGETRGDKRKTFYMHREILGLKHGDKRMGDHRDGNTLDNRRANLRIATASQNSWNKRVEGTAESGKQYRGTLRNRRGTWDAVIMFKCKLLYIGRFDTEEHAALAYDQAARKHHGEFAVLNFPSNKDYSALRRGRGSSSYLGVGWDKARGKWAAQISWGRRGERRRLRLGLFEDEISAARAYDKAARRYHGETAKLNFPSEDEC